MSENFYETEDRNYAILKGSKTEGSFKVPTLYKVKVINEKSGLVGLEYRGEAVSHPYYVDRMTFFDSVESAVEFCIARGNDRIKVAQDFAKQRPELKGQLARIVADELREVRGLE